MEAAAVVVVVAEEVSTSSISGFAACMLITNFSTSSCF